MKTTEEKIQDKRDEINHYYWLFTRTARGKPPPSHLYAELKELEDALKSEYSSVKLSKLDITKW